MNYLKILGSSGNKSKNFGTTSFQISNDTTIDAGNIINSLDDESYKINHIFVTHAHLDHVSDIPFMLDNYFTKREIPLTIYGSLETIQFLKEHIFNNKIWPDFSNIKLLNKDENTLLFKELKENEEIIHGKFKIKAIKTEHTDGSFGYIVSKNSSSCQTKC